VFRESDILIRWGGEEFLALARGGARAGAGELAERIAQAVREPLFVLPDGQQLRVTVSIGFAVFPLDPLAPQAWDWHATLNLADGALYAAKAQGRDGSVGAVAARGLLPAQAPLTLDAWLNEPRLEVLRHS
jgi:diguanylate cyclase (GGDEF)-like protein